MWLAQHVLQKAKRPYAVLTHTDWTVTNLTTYTFNNVKIGRPDPSRLIVVAIHGEDSAASFNLNSGTIGGDASDIILTGAVNLTINTGLMQLAVPVGEELTVTGTYSEATSGCMIGVYAIYNLKSHTPRKTAEAQRSSGSGVMQINTLGTDTTPGMQEAFCSPDAICIAAASNVGVDAPTWGRNSGTIPVPDGDSFIVPQYEMNHDFMACGALLQYPNNFKISPASTVPQSFSMQFTGSALSDLVGARWE